LLRALQRPEFNIRGIRRADLAPFLRQISPASITRYLWRLRQFALIKKVVHGYRYYLTRLGRSTIAAACRITEQSIVPALAHATPSQNLLRKCKNLSHKRLMIRIKATVTGVNSVWRNFSSALKPDRLPGM